MAELSQDQLRDFARIMLDEQAIRLDEQRDRIIKAAVTASLAAWGVDADDADELRELKLDRVHNRKWRLSVEAAQRVTLRTAITLLVSGFLGAIYMTFKIKVGS